jgi:hypothetical protein
VKELGELLRAPQAEVDLTVSHGSTTEGGTQFEYVLLVQGKNVGITLECIVSDARSLYRICESNPLEDEQDLVELGD